MKRILLLGFLLISFTCVKAQYYQLGFDSVRVKSKFKLGAVTTGSVTDSLLTKKANGGVFKVSRADFAPTASPSFTGVPLVPTAAVGTNTTQAASTAFVQAILPIALVTSADQTLGVTAFISYTGTGGTFTLPTPVSSTAKYWKIIHRGASGTLVVNTNGASNVLYNSGALTNTISLGVGEMLTLLSDGTYIIVYP